MSHHFLFAHSGYLPLANESVDTIVTDPPWSFDRRVRGGKAKAAAPYPMISDAVLYRHFAELGRVLKPGGHMYLFVPDQKLETAINGVALAYCFQRFASGVWVKTTKDGRVKFGLGHTLRMAHELILCMSKGHRKPFMQRNLPSVLLAPAEGGSIKPAQLYERLVLASTQAGSVVLDPWAGTDPLSRARLADYTTISSDLGAEWTT